MPVKPPGPILGPAAVRVIEKGIDTVFARAKGRVLGPQSVPKRVGVAFLQELSLPGLFERASAEEGVRPDIKTLAQILKIAGGYIDSTQERVKARAVKEVEAFLRDAYAQGVKTDLKTVLGGKLTEVFGDAVISMRRIIDTEANAVKNTGILDGIVRINAASGVEDPVVYLISVNDASRCDECERLHTLDGKTPRLWRLSELGHGYHKKGESNAKLGGLHPHCRCTLATLMVGYGFGADGRVKYIGQGHDDFALQRGTEKSEVDGLEPLEKSMRTGDLIAALARHGWALHRVTKEHYFRHPTVTMGAQEFLGTGRIQELTLSHDQQHTVPTEKARLVLRDAGLRVNNGEIEPDPKHRYYKFYQVSGHAPADAGAPRTWQPSQAVEGLRQLPLDKLAPTKVSEEWKVHQYGAALRQGKPIPHVTAMDAGDGTYWIDEGHEAHAAAQAYGLTHAPVLVKAEEVWYEDGDMGEELTKGRKDALQMYPEMQRQAPGTKAHVDWAYSKLPNENWSLWAVRHHRAKPEDFTPAVKRKIEHFAGSQHLPEVAAVRFGKEVDLHQGLGMLEGAERQYIDRSKKQLQLAPLPRTAKNILDFGDGWAWWDLGKACDIAEGKAMGHCGNVPSKQAGDSVLSLRRTHVLGGRKYYEPHLTFIRNGEFLGQMKGRGNEKPVQEYHSKIAALLELGYIPHGGGYLPENNFHVKDFDEGLYQQVAAKNPAVKFYREGVLEPNLEEKFLAGTYRVRQFLAQKPSLHFSMQERLVQDHDAWVRRVLAGNPSLYLSAQERLAQDGDIEVRQHLTQNPSLHFSLQERLAQDDDIVVRHSLARRPSLHPSLQERLAQDDDVMVRRGLARNPSLHPSLQERLVQDNVWVRRGLARNPSLHPSLQERLAQDDDVEVREHLVQNPSLHLSAQERLAQDNVLVRRVLAANHSLHPSVQERLVQDHDVWVREYLVQNPSLTPQVRALLERT